MEESKVMDRIGEVIERYGRDLLEDPDRLQQLLETHGAEGREWFFTFVMALRTALEMGYEMPVDSSEGVYVAEALEDRFGMERDKALWGASALAVLSRRFYGTSSEAMRSDRRGGSHGRGMIGRLTPSQVLWAAMGVLWLFAALSFGVYRMMSERGPDGGEFRITLLAPLSGPGGPEGQVMLRAAQMAVEQINSQGGVRGYRVRLLGFDSHDPGSPPWEELGDRMKERTRPHVVLSAVGDKGALGLVGWSERARTPIIAVDAKDPLVPAVSPYKPNPFMFAMLASPAMEGRISAYFVRQGLNRTGAFVVFDGSSRRSVEAERHFEASFGAIGGEVRGRFDVSTGGGGSLVPLQLLPGGSDPVVAFVFGEDLMRLFPHLRSSGFAGPLVALGNPEGLGRDMKLMSNSWWIADASPGDVYVQPFVEGYADRYKDRLPRYMVLPAMLAYDGVRWAGDALSRASSFSPEGIRYALSDTRSLSLVHATLSIDPSTHAPHNKAMALIYVGPRGAAFQRRIWMGPR
ncbi:ABC-type branched-chain amino acid transport system, periplasmic component [Thermanaerovibrio velox DSM 12556]|uniref:ABC-type branched-chain amino acid transport system, periplasmic component n=1 Tax=Thermanaerovibrio velox DSM 12556 TaxID=926567 RepID=H0UQK9_9BACT|nr:ABC transporter substrate-binding protein [Thermanaerovibrio velox]EHM10773.1 ABC-type branched-chain amino acid transport system, periplasmic component [Thermanaerovibrio velox DSM 12556]